MGGKRAKALAAETDSPGYLWLMKNAQALHWRIGPARVGGQRGTSTAVALV